MSAATEIRTPIPAKLAADVVISKLQDPLTTLNSQPIVTGYSLLPTPPGADSTRTFAYQVSEKVPYYGRLTYNATFTTQPNGMDARVSELPMGISMEVEMRVVDAESSEEGGWVGGGADGGRGKVLRDACTFHCNRLLAPFLLPFSRRTYRQAHVSMAKKIVRDLEKERAGAGGD